MIDGTDIKEYSIESLRKCFGVAFQDFNIFSVSLRENVVFSNWEERNKMTKGSRNHWNMRVFLLIASLIVKLEKSFQKQEEGSPAEKNKKLP